MPCHLLRFYIVNRPILFPLYFLLMFLLFLLGGLGISLLVFIVSYPEAPTIPGLLAVHGGSVFPGVLVGSFLISWVWAWSQIRKYIQRTSIVTLVLIIMSTILLGLFSFFGAIWYPENPSSLGHGISSRTLHGNSQLLIRSNTSGPIVLNQVYVRQLYPQQPGRFHPRVVFDGTSQELLIPGFVVNQEREFESETTGLTRILDELRGFVSPLSVSALETTLRGSLSLHPVLQQAISATQSLGLVLVQYGANISYRLFFMAGALSIFCAGAGLFQKGTGWPFWGTFMGLTVTLGGIVILDFFLSPDMKNIASQFLQPRAMAYLGPGILASVGLLFGFFGLVTSPLPNRSLPSSLSKRAKSKESTTNIKQEKKKKEPKQPREKKVRQPKPPKAGKAPKAASKDKEFIAKTSHAGSSLENAGPQKVKHTTQGNSEVVSPEADSDFEAEFGEGLADSGESFDTTNGPMDFDEFSSDLTTTDGLSPSGDITFEDMSSDEDDTFSFEDDFGSMSDDIGLDPLDDLDEEKL